MLMWVWLDGMLQISEPYSKIGCILLSNNDMAERTETLHEVLRACFNTNNALWFLSYHVFNCFIKISICIYDKA